MSVIQRAVDAVLDADPRLSDSTVRKIVQHLVVDGLLPSSGPAGVIDDNAREIANDYMDNCHTHKLGTPELKACMRKAGAKLTPSCVNALVESGEVSAKEVAQRKAAAGAAAAK